MTVELIQGLLLTFALVVILMPSYIRLLHAIGFGKRISEEGPETHYVKEGTPTMGGLLIVLVLLGVYFFLRAPDAATLARSPRFIVPFSASRARIAASVSSVWPSPKWW